MKHPHDILGIAPDAVPETIKRAFFKLAKSAHPDAGGSKEDFIRLRAAYEAMMDGGTSQQPIRECQKDAPETASASTAGSGHEDFRKAVRDRGFRDDWHPLTGHHWQSQFTKDVCWAVGLTPLSSGAIGTWLCYDGQSLDRSLWSFSFAITLAVLVWVCGLAAIVGASPATSSFAIYRRLMVLVLIVAALPLFQQSREMPPARHTPLISSELIPKWWPIPSGSLIRPILSTAFATE
jgi:hypothetical protein